MFDGSTYDPDRDEERLARQLRAVFRLMENGKPYTLAEIADRTGYPEASVSARLRDLRKTKFGGHQVLKLHVGRGLWLYRVVVREPEQSTR